MRIRGLGLRREVEMIRVARYGATRGDEASLGTGRTGTSA